MKTCFTLACVLLTTQYASAQILSDQLAPRNAGLLGPGVDQGVRGARGVVRQGIGGIENATQTMRGRVGMRNRAYQSSTQQYNRYPTQQTAYNQVRSQSYNSAPVQGQSYNAYAGQASSYGNGLTTGRTYRLRYDGNGREFICVNGQRIYFDGPNSNSQARDTDHSQRYQAAYGSYDQDDVQSAELDGNQQIDGK